MVVNANNTHFLSWNDIILSLKFDAKTYKVKHKYLKWLYKLMFSYIKLKLILIILEYMLKHCKIFLLIITLVLPSNILPNFSCLYKTIFITDKYSGTIGTISEYLFGNEYFEFIMRDYKPITPFLEIPYTLIQAKAARGYESIICLKHNGYVFDFGIKFFYGNCVDPELRVKNNETYKEAALRNSKKVNCMINPKIFYLKIYTVNGENIYDTEFILSNKFFKNILDL